MLLEALAGHPDGILEVAVLAQLLGQLREEARARLLVQLLPELVDAGVAGHGASRRRRSQALPRGPGTDHAVGRRDSTYPDHDDSRKTPPCAVVIAARMA